MNSVVIERARKGESEAFASLYDASYDRVYRYIFYRVLDTIQAEDIISDVYHKAYKNIRKFRGTTEGEWFSWLFHIAYTTIIDSTRSSKYHVESLEEITWEPSYEAHTSNVIDNKDTLAQVISYLKTLSQKEQSIITMRIWNDMSYEEIAKITGESEANLRKITSRTLAKIAANVSVLSFLSFLILHVWKA